MHRGFRVMSLLAVLALFSYCQDLSVGNEGLNAAVLQASFCLRVYEMLPLFNVLLMSIVSVKKLVLSARM